MGSGKVKEKKRKEERGKKRKNNVIQKNRGRIIK
jgi:hypothetical protein